MDIEKTLSKVSEEAKDFIRAVLQKDPERRLNAEQVLRHPWLQESDPNREAPRLENVIENLG